MATTETLEQHPALGEPGETCSGCGLPLATDQRYCLNCGTRRGDARLEFAQFLAPKAGAGAGTAAPNGAPASDGAPPERPPVRDSSPQMAVAGIALLGLMLLVGVLIGRGGESASPQPTVVRVGEGSTAATDTAAAAPAGTDKTGLKGKKGAGGDEEVVQASTEDLEALAGKTGEEYQEASQNLPDTIATPGEAPPKDSEKPGGGSTGVTID